MKCDSNRKWYQSSACPAVPMKCKACTACNMHEESLVKVKELNNSSNIIREIYKRHNI